MFDASFEELPSITVPQGKLVFVIGVIADTMIFVKLYRRLQSSVLLVELM